MLKSKRKFYTWSNNRIARVQLLLRYTQCVKYQVNCQHTLTKYDSLFTFVYTTEFIIAFCCSSPEQWIHCNSILINGTCNLWKKKLNKIEKKKSTVFHYEDDERRCSWQFVDWLLWYFKKRNNCKTDSIVH